jgi:hypothetical protein
MLGIPRDSGEENAMKPAEGPVEEVPPLFVGFGVVDKVSDQPSTVGPCLIE